MTFYYKTKDDSIVRSDVEIKEERFAEISEKEYFAGKDELAAKRQAAMDNFSKAAATARDEKKAILQKIGLSSEEADKVLSI